MRTIAQSEIVGLIDAIPPSRLAFLSRKRQDKRLFCRMVNPREIAKAQDA